MTLSDEALLELIGRIYDAAVDPDRWQDVLRGMHKPLGFGRVALINHDMKEEKATFAHSYDHDASTIREYSETWVRHDPGMSVLNAQPSGVATATNLHYSNRDWQRTEYFNEFGKRHEVHFQMGIVLAQDAHRNSFLGCARTRDEGGYSQDQIEVLHRLGPHLKRAFQIGRQFSALQVQRDGLARALDQARIGIVLFDEREAVAYANRCAESWLHGAEGLTLRAGRLEVRDPAAAGRLRRLIHAAVATGRAAGVHSGGVVAFPAAPPTPRLFAHVYPFHSPSPSFAFGNRRVCAVAFLSREGEAAPPAGEFLCGLYALTPAEARLVQSLAEGHTLADIAATLNLSRETLRSQLKAVFAKTGTHRQAELVRLVAGLPAVATAVAADSAEPAGARR